MMKQEDDGGPAASSQPDGAQDHGDGRSFFERNTEPREEIIEGILREKQLAAFAGPFTVGKSPLMADLIVHRVHGISWCGHSVRRGPVIIVDLENERGAWSRNVCNITHRLGVRFPCVPDEIDVYLQNDDLTEPATSQLLRALESKSIDLRLKLLEDALAPKPDALVIIDPVDLLFPIKKNDNTQVLALFKKFKQLLTRYPQAVIILTFNLRKQDRRSPRPDLLLTPRDWLEEIAGSLDLCNRSDVRIGMDFHDDADGVRVINGVRRNEEMHPLLVRPIALNDDAQTLAGFELVPPNEVGLCTLLTPGQLTYWRALPRHWRFDEVADKVVPRATLFRIIQRVGPLALEEKEGVYRKLVD
jgi:AAA domain-containing protein